MKRRRGVVTGGIPKAFADRFDPGMQAFSSSVGGEERKAFAEGLRKELGSSLPLLPQGLLEGSPRLLRGKSSLVGGPFRFIGGPFRFIGGNLRGLGSLA